MFNMLISSVQSFKLIAWKPGRSCLHNPILVAKLKIVSFVKDYFFVCPNSHAHFQYAYHICAKFQTDCLKTLGGLITQILKAWRMDGRGQNLELNLKTWQKIKHHGPVIQALLA